MNGTYTYPIDRRTIDLCCSTAEQKLMKTAGSFPLEQAYFDSWKKL